jgi:TetR/AcrR family transcriptional repressor of nem operon
VSTALATTRDELIDQATILIETRGFCAFSYADLAEQVGIRKPSIHHHFPAKADLGVAVVQRLHGRMVDQWAELERAHPAVPARIQAIFRHIADVAACGDRICPIGALQSEFNAVPEPVQTALRAFSNAYLDTWMRWLDEGRRAGDLVFPGQPRAMAQIVVCVVQATLQRQRANATETTSAALGQLVRLLGL